MSQSEFKIPSLTPEVDLGTLVPQGYDEGEAMSATETIPESETQEEELENHPLEEKEDADKNEAFPESDTLPDIVQKNAVRPSILGRIHSVANAPPVIKCMFYGGPGVGKTVLSARAPRPLILDAEHGTRSLKNHPELTNVQTIQLRSYTEIEDVFWAAREGDPFFDDIDTFVIDSWTETQKRQLDELLKENYAKNQFTNSGAERDPYLAFMQDYQKNTEILRRLAIQFRDLEKNLIITALEKEDKDDREGFLYVRPALSPKLSETMVAIMDVVGHMTIERNEEGVTRYMQVHPTRNVVAKSRIGGLPTVIENPTFDLLLEKQKEGKTNE